MKYHIIHNMVLAQILLLRFWPRLIKQEICYNAHLIFHSLRPSHRKILLRSNLMNLRLSIIFLYERAACTVCYHNTRPHFAFSFTNWLCHNIRKSYLNASFKNRCNLHCVFTRYTCMLPSFYYTHAYPVIDNVIKKLDIECLVQ